VRSPTIHGSLEFDMNKAGFDDRDTDEIRDQVTRSSLETPNLIMAKAQSAKKSYSRAIAEEPESLTPFIAKRAASRMIGKKGKELFGDKENERPLEQGQGDAGKSPAEVFHSTNYDAKDGLVNEDATSKETETATSNWGSVAVYCTPAGQTIRKVPLTNAQIVGLQEDTPFGSQLRKMMNDEIEAEKLVPPCSDKIHDRFRSPRSKTKGPPLPRRVFNSMERQVDRMITALTPKRYRTTGTPVKMRHTKTLVNVSTTSSKSPEQVLNELMRVFKDKGIDCKQRDWTIRGKAKDTNGRTTLTLELEVVFIDRLNMVGIRRKRLNGESFMYKRVCEDILNLAGL